jgi:hypothetical protein
MQEQLIKPSDLILKPGYTSQFFAGHAAALILASLVPQVRVLHVHDFDRMIGSNCGSSPQMRCRLYMSSSLSQADNLTHRQYAAASRRRPNKMADTQLRQPRDSRERAGDCQLHFHLNRRHNRTSTTLHPHIHQEMVRTR